VGPKILQVVDVSTGVITNLGIAGRSPSFSPDGRRIVHQSTKGSWTGIDVLDRVTGAVTQISNRGRFPDWRR
jgi:Tol biopolymer transport system component